MEDSSHLVAEMQSTEADIIKFVSNAATITEIANAFDLLSNSQVWFPKRKYAIISGVILLMFIDNINSTFKDLKGQF